MTSRAFADLRAPQVGDLSADSVLVQPVGAVEQHGPHLPLATDLIVASTLATDVVADRTDLDLWLLPPLAYSKSDEHAWAPGTIWLSAPTLLAVLDDIGRSLATTPARRLVFLNGHGGNSALLQVACRTLRREHGLRTFLMHPNVPPDQGGESPAEELGMGIHGGLEETSLLLHLRPDLVDLAAARRAVPSHLDGFEHVGFGRRVSFGWLSDDFGGDGVIGDPTGATAERGKARYAAMLASAGDALAEVARFDPHP